MKPLRKITINLIDGRTWYCEGGYVRVRDGFVEVMDYIGWPIMLVRADIVHNVVSRSVEHGAEISSKEVDVP